MGRNGPKILEHFIIPHLDKETFGEKLKWVSKPDMVFQLPWFHKSGPKWRHEDNQVFEAWDRLKGRTSNTETFFSKKNGVCSSKQRFRSALMKKRKDGNLLELPSPKDYKLYKILLADRNMMPNYDIPDTSKGDFYCVLCDARMNCQQVWETHKIGKRHITNKKKAPGEAPSKVKAIRLEAEPLVAELLKNETEQPIVGLDFVCETRRADENIEPFYSCHLCQAVSPKSGIIDHLVSFKHQLAYLKMVDPKKTQRLESFGLSKCQFEPMIREHCFEKEQQYGRGKMEVKIEKSHGQVVQNGRLIKKPFLNSSWPEKSEYPKSSLHHHPSNRYEAPSPSDHNVNDRYESEPHGWHGQHYDPYGPSTSRYEPQPAMEPMDVPWVPKLKPKKSNISMEQFSPKIREYSPDSRTPEREASKSRSPTPEPEFQFTFEEHAKYLTPIQVKALIGSVYDDLKTNPESFRSDEDKMDLLIECAKIQFAALIKNHWDESTPEEKKVLEFKFSKQGTQDRVRRKREALRVPGVTRF